MPPSPLAAVLQHLRREPSRTWSIVVTVFGDAIVPRGSSVWLGTLLTLFETLGIGAGVVRTAMSRLTADGWLVRTRVGRNSFYRLDESHAGFARATARIYGPPAPRWDGRFRLVLADADHRPEFLAAGYGAAAPGLFVTADPALEPPVAGSIVLHATADDASIQRLAAQTWPLDRVAAAYAEFTEVFRPMEGWSGFDALDALAARVLLVHEYRRIVLQDPLLPAAILPPNWPGEAACRLCATLYPRLLPASEAWLDAHARTESGPLPAARLDLWQRFVVLPSPPAGEGRDAGGSSAGSQQQNVLPIFVDDIHHVT